MTRATRAAVLALIATTVGAWPALDEKLQSYPALHARETAKIKAGDAKGARYILVNAFHGLGNREQALLSSFALALATDSALFVSWTPIGCNSNADVNTKKCAAASLEDLYANPGFEWGLLRAGKRGRSRVRGGRGVRAPDVQITHATETTLLSGELPSTAYVHTDHNFLKAILCNVHVKEMNLFPPDAVEAQRRLAEFLLKPSLRVARAASQAMDTPCAVGLHLRKYDGSTGDAWRAADVWPRVKGLLGNGGFFVAADGNSANLKKDLIALARRDGVAVLGPVSAGLPALTALAERVVLSSCNVLAPTRSSTFFHGAAVAATRRPAARAVFACPNATTLLSPFDGRAIPCLFEPTCPTQGALPAIQYAHGATRIYNAQTAFRQARVAEAAQTYPSCGRWPCPSWGPPTFLDPHVAHGEEH